MAGVTLASCSTGASLILLLWTSLATGAQFEQSQVSVNESGGSIRVRRNSYETTSTITIVFMTLEAFSQQSSCRPPTEWGVAVGNLTAQYGQAEARDFSAATVFVTFAKGQMQASVNVVLMDDDIAEAQESFVSVITNGSTAEEYCALLITIIDNDGVLNNGAGMLPDRVYCMSWVWEQEASRLCQNQMVGLRFNTPVLNTVVESESPFNELSILKTGSNEPNITVSVEIRLSSSATNGSDFNLPMTSFTLSSTTDAAIVPVQILDGYSLAGNGETIVLCLSRDTAQNEVQVELLKPYCATINLIDDSVTVIGYFGQGLQFHPLFEVTEGNRINICFGLVDGNTSPREFLDIIISMRPDDQTQAHRISASRSTVLQFQISPTPQPIQLASIIPRLCFMVEAIDNEIVDGHTSFTIQIVENMNTVPVIVIAENATLKVLDNDVLSFLLSHDPSELVVREGGIKALNLTISHGQPNTTLTYVLSLRPQDLRSDFSYSPIVFEPLEDSKVISISIIDDLIPEPLRVLNFSIESAEIADGREGLPPLTRGSLIVELYDNDFAIGFSVSDLMISEGSSQLNLSILDPTGDNVDPQASFPLTLQLLRVDDPSGAVLVTLASTNVQLNSTNPSASIQLTVDLCSSGHHYRLSYNYTGPEAYTVLSNTRGEVDLHFADDADCDAEATVCIPCIVAPIVLIILVGLICCLPLLIALLVKSKLFKKYRDYNPQKRGKPVELERKMETTQTKACGQLGENIEMTSNQVYGLRPENQKTDSEQTEQEEYEDINREHKPSEQPPEKELETFRTTT